MEATIEQAGPIEPQVGNGHAAAPPVSDVDVPFAMGWMRDLPDVRDYTTGTEEVATPRLRARRRDRCADAHTPSARTDLRQWCSPIEDQRTIGSHRAGRGRHRRVLPAPRVRQAPRRLTAVRLQGDPQPARPDRRHRRLAAQRHGRPVHVRGAAGEVLAVRRQQVRRRAARVRVRARPGLPGGEVLPARPVRQPPCPLLEDIKKHLAAGVPSMFGFTVYDSISQAQGWAAAGSRSRSRRTRGRRPRRRGHRLRRLDRDQAQRRIDAHARRPHHPQLVGHRLGRPRLRLPPGPTSTCCSGSPSTGGCWSTPSGSTRIPFRR